MHVKRIFKPTVREALAEARALLGPDALVLSTELVPARGWRGLMGQRIVRLTAAAERPEPLLASADVSAGRPAPVSADRPEPAPVERPAPVSVARGNVAARLSAAGLDRAIAGAVAARLSEQECRGASDKAIRRALRAELESVVAADPDYERCEVFMGPPGVGKTTTIAKIAAQERARHDRTINLIAADAARAGAVDQLRSYAAIVRSPFRVARSARELDEALGASRHPTLVDTAGRSSKDVDGLADLFETLARRRRVRSHLVLAADTSPATARRILERYKSFKPSRVAITKLDESESLMPLLGVIRDSGLPVSYLTAGQRVPEDLWRATPAALAAALLGGPELEVAACL